MKVLIITSSFLETSIPLSKYLCIQGNNVTLVAVINKKQLNANVLDFSNISVKNGFSDDSIKNQRFNKLRSYIGEVILRPFFINGSSNVFNDLISLYHLISFIKKEKFDIVHLIGSCSLFLYIIILFRNIIDVHTFHEVNNHDNNKTPIVTKILLRNAYTNNKIRIIVHSKASYDRLLGYYKSKFQCINSVKNRLSIIPFGLFETYKLFEDGLNIGYESASDDCNIVLFFGRINKSKGLIYLVKAFEKAYAINNNIKLIIAGEGKIDFDINTCYNIEIINKRLTNEEIIFYIKQSTVVVCPYLSASQSGIPKTVFLFNKPLIASKLAGFKEDILNNITGILVTPESVVELTEAILKIIKDENESGFFSKTIYDKYNNENSNNIWLDYSLLTLKLYQNSIENN